MKVSPRTHGASTRRHRRQPRIEGLEVRLQPGSVISPALIGDVMLSLLPVDATTEVAVLTHEKRKAPRRSPTEDLATIPFTPPSALFRSIRQYVGQDGERQDCRATAAPG